MNKEEKEFKEKMLNLDNIYELISLKKTMTSKEVLAIIGVEEFLRMYNSIPKECAIISINEKYSKEDLKKYGDNSVKEEILQNFDSFLKIAFHDTYEEDTSVDAISDDEVKQIAEFIYNNKNKQFLIHCGAGMSRSAAVGKAILLWIRNLNYNETTEVDNHYRYLPNKLVLKKLFIALKLLM